MAVSIYLTFDGTCEEAFNTYADLMGGEILAIMRYEGSPAEDMVSAEYRDRVMHAAMTIGGSLIMGSDRTPAYYKQPAGMHASISVETPEEADRIFAGLSEGGTVVMPIEETFWARRFGMVTDRFGTPWMVNCDKPA